MLVVVMLFYFPCSFSKHLNNIKVWSITYQKYSNEELAVVIVYRKFRIAKGFTQEEATGDEISTTLSFTF